MERIREHIHARAEVGVIKFRAAMENDERRSLADLTIIKISVLDLCEYFYRGALHRRGWVRIANSTPLPLHMKPCMPHTRDMKRTLPIIVIALAVSSLASADNLRNKIESMNRKIHNAFMKKDINAFEQITREGITSDFKYVENGTPESYDEMVAQMKQSFNMMQKVTAANSRILKLSI